MPSLATLLVAALPACGDDKGDDSTAPGSTSTPDSSTTGEATVPTTSQGEESTEAVDPSTTAVDPSTTSGPDMTTTVGEESTGTPGDCAAPNDESDEDADGVANNVDNCPCDANPNQLDYDQNTVGNVCDVPIVMATVAGAPPEFNKLDTTARAEQMGASCEFPVSLVVIGGRAEITLDDMGTGKLYIPSLMFADTPEQQCDIKLGPVPVVSLKLFLKDFFADGIDPFVVGFPFKLTDHAAGDLIGTTDSPHALNITATIVITESSNEMLAPVGENPLMMLPGQFSTGDLNVSKNGGNLALSFADDQFVVFDQMTMGGIHVTMTGLAGTLQLGM